MKVMIVAGVLCAGPVSAHAQFNDLMRTMQTIAPPVLNKGKEPAASSVNSASKAVKPASETLSPKQESTHTQSVADEPSSQVDPRICLSDSIAFSCKINNKQLIYCKTFETEDPYMSMTLNHVYDTGKNELSFSSDQRGPFLLSQEESQRRSVTTVYFTQKSMTYGISECDGMFCNPEERYWFTTFKGNEKISQTFCDPNTETSFNFPVEFDKKGKLVAQLKRVLSIKQSKLKFETD